jgi:hypothetical protein
MFSKPLVCHSMVLVPRCPCFGKKVKLVTKNRVLNEILNDIDPNNFYTLLLTELLISVVKYYELRRVLLLIARDRETRIFLHLPLLNKILYLIEIERIYSACGPLI